MRIADLKEKLAFLRRKNIRQQLYIIYFVAIFLPISIIGSFLIFNTTRLLSNYHRDLLKSDNLRVKTILFEITTQIYNISEEIAFDGSVRELLASSFDDDTSLAQAVSRITLLDNYSENYAEIESIEIYTDNPDFSDYKQFHRVYQIIRDNEWFKKAAGQASVFWMPMVIRDGYDNAYWNLCLVRKISLVDSAYNAVLVIRISDNYLKTRVSSQEYDTMVSVDQGPVFFSSDRDYYGQEQLINIDYQDDYYQYTGNLELGDGTALANLSTLSLYQSDSRAYICTISDQAYSNIRDIISFCLLIIAAALLIPGILIHFFTSYFTRRVLTLRQAMHQASNEDYELVDSVKGQDELSEAFADLEVMVQRIKEKDANMYEARISEKELASEQQAMEFKMLASQINPHFLYNTLESIRMKAFTAGDREVATAIKLLGKSLRYVLENTGTDFTALSNELEHVQVYLSIQKLRFGDKFDSRIEIAEDVDTDKLFILPLLLQPIVENALLHGLEEKESGGEILISIYKERDNIHIDVVDNGSGMEKRQLMELHHDIEARDVSRRGSIGLYNINQRMKLTYGEMYGLQIDSEPGRGTRVRLCIPYEKMVKT